jgi:hypothetical protein
MDYEKLAHTQPVMYFEDKCDREVFSQNLQPFPSFLPSFLLKIDSQNMNE